MGMGGREGIRDGTDIPVSMAVRYSIIRILGKSQLSVVLADLTVFLARSSAARQPHSCCAGKLERSKTFLS